jgi:RNA polymerase sigma-70 factor (ECF subfamily)
VGETSLQDERYLNASKEFEAAIVRLAGAYEADPGLRPDLVQEIHVALWRSFALYDGRCSLRTWVYRVAHNKAASHSLKRKRLRPDRLFNLDDIAEPASLDNPESTVGDRRALERLTALIHALKMTDRQVILLYLEDLDAAAIGEITGLSPGAVATKIHRVKTILNRQFHAGGPIGL